MSTVKSRNLQGEPGALPDPAVSNRLPASRAVFMGCFHWLGTQTAWCPSPGLPDPSPSPHTGLLGHGEEADRAHHFHRYTRSHKHREDGLCSLAIQEGKQCPMGGGRGGSDSCTVEGSGTESQYEEPFTRLARSQGPPGWGRPGWREPWDWRWESPVATLTNLGHGRLRKSLRLYWENTQTRFFLL